MLTSNEVQEILQQKGWEADYPLFTAVNRIVSDYFPPSDIVNYMDIGTRPMIKAALEVDENEIPVITTLQAEV